MASTSIKPTAGSSSKQSARSVSASRVAGTKSSKAQKVSSPAPKAKASSAPPAASKKLTAVPPPPAIPAEARTPQNAKSELKAQFARLSAATSQITGLKRTLNKSFYDVGTLLNQIRNERLYEVKGYGSFESFVERELDLNKVLCMRAARIAEAIHRDQALAAGLERAAAAVAALDGETEPATPTRPAGSPAGGIPVHKQ
jgi:hypothetical protein